MTDATTFLRYCCPECDEQCKTLEKFSEHALSNHSKSTTLFDKVDGTKKDHKKWINILGVFYGVKLP